MGGAFTRGPLSCQHQARAREPVKQRDRHRVGTARREWRGRRCPNRGTTGPDTARAGYLVPRVSRCVLSKTAEVQDQAPWGPEGSQEGAGAAGRARPALAAPGSLQARAATAGHSQRLRGRGAAPARSASGTWRPAWS